MALTDESNGIGATMLVGPTGVGNPYPMYPMYMNGNGNGNNNGFGGDWAWILLLLLIGGGNWGNGMGGGFGGGGYGGSFPWILNGQNGINNNVSDGFRDAQLHDSVTSVRDGVSNLATQLCGCCGDIQMGLAGVNQGVSNAAAGIQNSLCQGFAGTTAAITGAQNAVTQQLYSNELASLNRSFAEQTANAQGFNSVQSQLAQCCCDNRLATNDLKYTIATENCADRAALSEGVRDIIASQTAGTQRILDQLCQDKIDAKNDTIAQLRQELIYARGQASQIDQTAQILANNNAQTALFQQGLNNEVDALYNRLSNCPVPTVPVYGRQPIFTCQNNNNGCGCGCGNNGF